VTNGKNECGLTGSFRRSPSPHKMMLETSFCGSKPIPTKSMDMESPPKEAVVEDSEQVLIVEQSFSPVSSSYLPTEPRSPRSPRSPRDFDRSKRYLPCMRKLIFANKNVFVDWTTGPSSGRRSVSPFKMVYETSFCGSKPIPTKSMEQDSPPKDLPSDLSSLLGGPNLLATLTTSVQVHQHNIVHASASSSPPQSSSKGTIEDSVRKSSLLGTTSPQSPKSSDHWRPVSPRLGTTPSSPTLCTPPYTSADKDCRSNNKNYSPGGSGGATLSSSSNCRNSSGKNENSVFKWPEPVSANPPAKNANQNQHHQYPPLKLPPQKSDQKNVSSSKGSSLPQEEETTQLKEARRNERTEKTGGEEKGAVSVEDSVPLESKGLFHTSDSFDEDGDLPYVPTTLPQEKPSIVPIFPSKERRSVTTPVQRPKVNRPANPASLNDYIVHSSAKGQDGDGGESPVRMKINLPREDSLGDTSYNQNSRASKSPKKKGATSWMDFAEMGLRSPREIRRKMMKEDLGAGDDLSSYHR